MSESRKVLFIINRYSGTGYRESLEGKIVSACEQRGLECSIEFTRKPGHGTTLAKMAVKKNYAAVFAVGGDGTVNEVAQGLLHSTVPLGIIPKGSGNGLARHLHIPLQIDKALHLLELKRVIPIDTFTINGRLSLNVSGIGFDGFVAGQFGKDGKRGLAGYGKLVVTHFKRFNEFSSILKTENDSIQRK
ncbi:MAG TPA: acylglycerol kinase family protein, partial [Cyclobacteriaceae bacterium]|nr:acylglycerol kinase family protein [Cyclobacteriaceae bacterium]